MSICCASPQNPRDRNPRASRRGVVRSGEVDSIPWAVRWSDENDGTEVDAPARGFADPALEREDLKWYVDLYAHLPSAGRNFNLH